MVIALVISIPILFCCKIKYLILLVEYSLYDKSETKLEISGKMIQTVMPSLLACKVVVDILSSLALCNQSSKASEMFLTTDTNKTAKQLLLLS
jgi:hypothetical protein